MNTAQSKMKSDLPSKDQSRFEWFLNSRLGLFIHWGVYALHEKGEWGMHDQRMTFAYYDSLAKSFNPEEFNAIEVVRLAKDAGMKYIVITAKHHDGFCMWDTKYTDFNIVRFGHYGRDPMKELADACQKQGMKLGFYYSVRDWHHPNYTMRYEKLDAPGPKYKGWYAFPKVWTNDEIFDCGCYACTHNLPITKETDPRPTVQDGADMNLYLDDIKGQLRELLANYGPVAVLWFDGQDIVDSKKARVDEMLQEIKRIQPNILVNDRIAFKPNFGDYAIHEGVIPDEINDRPWETCITMNNGSWGYKKYDSWKSARQIIQNLADVVSKNGNLLVNIAPDAKGEITGNYLNGLADIGHWMRINGESIYGCGSSNLNQPSWGRITQKGKKFFLHVFDRPGNGILELTINQIKPKRVFELQTQKRLSYSYVDGKALISLPKELPDLVNYVIVVE
jgi:alpha-L-fucosidase